MQLPPVVCQNCQENLPCGACERAAQRNALLALLIRVTKTLAHPMPHRLALWPSASRSPGRTASAGSSAALSGAQSVFRPSTAARPMQCGAGWSAVCVGAQNESAHGHRRCGWCRSAASGPGATPPRQQRSRRPLRRRRWPVWRESEGLAGVSWCEQRTSGGGRKNLGVASSRRGLLLCFTIKPRPGRSGGRGLLQYRFEEGNWRAGAAAAVTAAAMARGGTIHPVMRMRRRGLGGARRGGDITRARPAAVTGREVTAGGTRTATKRRCSLVVLLFSAAVQWSSLRCCCGGCCFLAFSSSSRNRRSGGQQTGYGTGTPGARRGRLSSIVLLPHPVSRRRKATQRVGGGNGRQPQPLRAAFADQRCLLTKVSL